MLLKVIIFTIILDLFIKLNHFNRFNKFNWALQYNSDLLMCFMFSIKNPSVIRLLGRQHCWPWKRRLSQWKLLDRVDWSKCWPMHSEQESNIGLDIRNIPHSLPAWGVMNLYNNLKSVKQWNKWKLSMGMMPVERKYILFIYYFKCLK
jgi:hypothetical protein